MGKKAIGLIFVALLAGCATGKPKAEQGASTKNDSRRKLAANDLPFKVIGVDVVQLSAPPKSGIHEWYVEKLGIAPNQYASEEWQQFDFSGSSAFAINYSETEPVLLKQRFVISFKVSDIKAAVTSMTSRGVKFLNPENPIYESFWGYRATFQDPRGIYLQILEDKP